MDHPDSSTTDDSGDSGDVAVELDTLKTSDGIAPEVGDTVDVQVSGKVSRIEGNCAYVTPDTCNGKPPPDMVDEADTADSLRNKAQAADESDYA
jgi:hypothetical protein